MSKAQSQQTNRLARQLLLLRADYTFVLTDAALMVVSYLLVYSITPGLTGPPWGFLVLAPALHLLCNAAFGLYGLIWRQVGIEEARRLIAAGLAVTVLAAIAAALFGSIPLAIVVLGPVVATLLTGTSRFRSRLFAWQRRDRSDSGQRLVVVGAGRTGVNLVRDLLSNPRLGARPVAMVDDDPRLRGRVVTGVPVVCGLEQLPDFAADWQIDQLVLAVPSADKVLVQRASFAADRLNVPLKVVPSVHEFIAGVSPLEQVRKASIEDLLGRRQVETDLDGVRRLLAGKTVLLTGAGGSIGSEIARQVARFSPRSLVMLDHDETHLFDARLSIDARDRDHCVEVLADIRDAGLMREVFATHRPDVVFHAAAHKHVPILEQFPIEGIATNVFGTLNLLDAAAEFGTDRFVLISTDKAVRPKNVLGATKWLAEQLLEIHSPTYGRYCAVRFGNVLGSRGSVVPTFERQIASGGPVTVTHPDMTRYFMSIVEAVQLVLQAAEFTDDNDLFVLEMGAPVRILDLARLMVRLSGHTEREVPIDVTGPRAGEKLAEELYAEGEHVVPTGHPSIARLVPSGDRGLPSMSALEELRLLVQQRQTVEARRLLFALANPAPDASALSDASFPRPRVGSQTGSRMIAGPQPASPFAAKGVAWNP